MKITIEIKELDLEQEKRFIDFLYYKILDEPSLSRFSVRSDNFIREYKEKEVKQNAKR
jgi:hypothetical protein